MLFCAYFRFCFRRTQGIEEAVHWQHYFVGHWRPCDFGICQYVSEPYLFKQWRSHSEYLVVYSFASCVIYFMVRNTASTQMSEQPNILIGCAETFKARSNYLQIFRNTDSRPHFLKSATFYRA